LTATLIRGYQKKYEIGRNFLTIEAYATLDAENDRNDKKYAVDGAYGLIQNTYYSQLVAIHAQNDECRT
jgi:hypothetical protein